MLHLPLGIDEGGLAVIAKEWVDGVGGSTLYGSHWIDRPPLLLLLYAGAAKAAGALGIRLLGMVAALAVVTFVSCAVRELGSDRAARWAVVLATALVCSPAIDAHSSDANLLGIACTSGMLFVLARSLRTGAMWMLPIAGCAGACALLIKQSFIDAPIACAIVALAYWIIPESPTAGRSPWRGVRAAALLVVGAMPAVAAALVWAAGTPVGVDGFTQAMVGFRVDAINALDNSTVSLPTRMQQLVPSGIGSGIVVVVLVAMAVVWRSDVAPRSHRTLVAGMLAGGLAGMLAGGYYWAHYWIQLIPAAVAGASLVLAHSRGWWGKAVPALCVVCALAGITYAATSVELEYRDERALGTYVDRYAQPDDTMYVLYARANLAWYGHRHVPFPYLWSSMLRAIPDAKERMLRMLSSDDRPTWVVVWQEPAKLDKLIGGKPVDPVLQQYYTPVATVCDRSILLRSDSAQTRKMGDRFPPPRVRNEHCFDATSGLAYRIRQFRL